MARHYNVQREQRKLNRWLWLREWRQWRVWKAVFWAIAAGVIAVTVVMCYGQIG